MRPPGDEGSRSIFSSGTISAPVPFVSVSSTQTLLMQLILGDHR